MIATVMPQTGIPKIANVMMSAAQSGVLGGKTGARSGKKIAKAKRARDTHPKTVHAGVGRCLLLHLS